MKLLLALLLACTAAWAPPEIPQYITTRGREKMAGKWLGETRCIQMIQHPVIFGAPPYQCQRRATQIVDDKPLCAVHAPQPPAQPAEAPEPTEATEDAPAGTGGRDDVLARAAIIAAYIDGRYPAWDDCVRDRVAFELADCGTDEWRAFVDVADGESRGDPGAIGGAGEIGLWQIHPCHKVKTDFALLKRTDAVGISAQVRFAVRFRKTNGWSAWTVARNLGIGGAR